MCVCVCVGGVFVCLFVHVCLSVCLSVGLSAHTGLSQFLLQRLIPHFNALQELNLHGNQLGYVGAAVVGQAITTCPTLVSLNLSANLIGGKDAQQLLTSLFGPISRLVFLDLSDNKLGNEGAITIAPLCMSSVSQICFVSVFGRCTSC